MSAEAFRSSPNQSSFRLGVLGSAEGWYMRDLVRAAAVWDGDRRVAVEPLAFSQLAVAYDGGPASRMMCGLDAERNAERNAERTAKPIAPVAYDAPVALDALLVRTMPLGSLEQTIFRMNALHVAHASGVRVINPPRALEIAIDKWLTLETLRQVGLEIPRTVCCQTRSDAMAAWRDVFGGDCIVKPIFGGEGRGILRVADADMAWRVFSTLEQIQSVIYLQEFLPSCGYDLRLLVIDDAVFCVRRENPDDWRTNVGRGGRFAEQQPSFEQVAIAFRASKAIGTWMAGVDVLPTKDGRNVLLEVNAVPGWRATAAALQVDIARRILERLMGCKE